ncbi:MAG: response regulator [Parvibaculaceae bacterium]
MSESRGTVNMTLLADIKILVVEDSATMRNLLTTLLTTMGIGEIICANNGEEGVAAFATHAPDLIITDGMMQPMTGYAMTRAIRQMHDKQGSDVPVVMLSGHGDPDIVEWARDEGVNDYIVKPVTPELLYERVLAAIEQPLHIIETPTYRGPSPRRRLTAHHAAIDSAKPH